MLMFEVKESPLHGRGLFAKTFIPQDTLIGTLQAVPAYDHEHDDPYVLWVDGVTPVRVICDLRFINHDDEPNAAYFDDLTVVALRDIQPGEEILHDYIGDGEDGGVEVFFDDDQDAVGESAGELVLA